MKISNLTYNHNQFTVVHHDPEIREPCRPSPCGINAVCRERNNAGSCSCLPGYFGDPYSECRPECVNNNDCPKQKACFNNKCRDPCVGLCGSNTECQVVNHTPYCSCVPGYTGNPSVACLKIRTFLSLWFFLSSSAWWTSFKMLMIEKLANF